jgi:hypothetical protein
MTPPAKPRWSLARTVIVATLVATTAQGIAVLAYAVSTGQYIVMFSLPLTTPVVALGSALVGAALHWIVVTLRNRGSGTAA